MGKSYIFIEDGHGKSYMFINDAHGQVSHFH